MVSDRLTGDCGSFVPRFLMCPTVKIGWSFNGLWTEVGHITVLAVQHDRTCHFPEGCLSCWNAISGRSW